METTELEAEVYEALTNSEELMSMLPVDGDILIYHLFAPAGDKLRYPLLVYAPISDIPVDYGDDEEKFHRVTIRISIVTNDGEYAELNRIIREIMTQQLDFIRVNTVPTMDFEYQKVILNCDYQTIIEAGGIEDG